MAHPLLPSSQPQVNGDIDEPSSSTPLGHDWACSICLETLMDAVQTECGHKFCRFCIRRWLEFNPINRRCPICRSAVGICVILPQLNNMISTSLQSSMTPLEGLQRQLLQAQRESYMNTSRDIENNLASGVDGQPSPTSSSVATALVSNALWNSIEAARQELRLRNLRLLRTLRGRNSREPTLFPLEEEPIPLPSPPTPPTVRERVDRVVVASMEVNEPVRDSRFRASTSVPTATIADPQRDEVQDMSWITRGIDWEERMTTSRQRRRNILAELPDLPETVVQDFFSQQRDYSPNSNPNAPHPQGTAQRRRRLRIETLITHHSFHVRRLETAFTRIQEAEREVVYHNEELRTIYREMLELQYEFEQQRHAQQQTQTTSSAFSTRSRSRHGESGSGSHRRRREERHRHSTAHSEVDAMLDERLRTLRLSRSPRVRPLQRSSPARRRYRFSELYGSTSTTNDGDFDSLFRTSPHPPVIASQSQRLREAREEINIPASVANDGEDEESDNENNNATPAIPVNPLRSSLSASYPSRLRYDDDVTSGGRSHSVHFDMRMFDFGISGSTEPLDLDQDLPTRHSTPSATVSEGVEDNCDDLVFDPLDTSPLLLPG